MGHGPRATANAQLPRLRFCHTWSTVCGCRAFAVVPDPLLGLVRGSVAIHGVPHTDPTMTQTHSSANRRASRSFQGFTDCPRQARRTRSRPLGVRRSLTRGGTASAGTRETWSSRRYVQI
eukprot:1797143-Prymnesium_polylepis.1